jgi:4-aminobutyrate aminotransferase-like enzyme
LRRFDAEGREYLDFFAGILTTSVGHCHPEVNARVQEQVERLGHTSTLYVTENQVEVARQAGGDRWRRGAGPGSSPTAAPRRSRRR